MDELTEKNEIGSKWQLLVPKADFVNKIEEE